MLVLAEVIACSTRGFACILAKWFWPAVMSLSLTYGSPDIFREAKCWRNERVLDSLYFGDDSFRNSYGRNNPIFEYWSYTLFVDLQNGCGTWIPLSVDQYS